MMVCDQKGEEEMQNNENDTVNMKCDLSHYLIAIKKTKLSVISEAQYRMQEKMAMPELEAQQFGDDEEDDQIVAIKKPNCEPPLKQKDNNSNIAERKQVSCEEQLMQEQSRRIILEEEQCQQQPTQQRLSSSKFIQFEELVRLTQLETIIRRQAPHHVRMRLCGGGEDSINNGTSAWGTPTATNNTAGSTWGPIGGGSGSAQQSGASIGPSGASQPPVAGGSNASPWGGASQQNGGSGGQTSKVNAPLVNPNSVGASGVSSDGSGNSAGNGGNGGGAGGPWNGAGVNAQAAVAAQGTQVGAGPAGSGTNAAGASQLEQPGAAGGVSQQQQSTVAAAQQQQAAGQAGQQEAVGAATASAGGAAAAVVQSSAAKNQLEHLNSLRESLFAQDGWGSENVDQDTQWDVPASPEPSGKTDPNSATSGPTAGIPMWKTNTGTELWEANLRNGGQLPQQQPPVQKTPWGPANNYGGTWGEDDEANEPGSVWNGAMGGASVAGGPGGPGGVGLRDQPPGPQQSQQHTGQQQGQQPPWNTAGGMASGGTGGMWTGASASAPGGVGTMAPNVPAGLKKDNEWGTGIGSGATTGGNGAWGASGGGAADNRVGGNQVAAGGLDPTGLDMRNIRIASAMDSNREIRGDPRGISGRLNGNVGLWDQHQMSSMQQKMPPTVTTPGTPTGGVGGQGGGGQWPSNNPLGSINNGVAGGGGAGGKLVSGSGWDDPTAGGGPPAVGGVRRNNMDDGTALWGQNALNRQNSGNVSGWKDNSGGGLGPPGTEGGMGRNMMHRNAMVGGGGNLPGNGGLVGRGVGGPGGPMKPESLWGQNPAAALGAGPRGNAGNWGGDDVSSGAGGGNWGEEKPPGGGMGGNSLWNDGANNNWNNKGKMSTSGGGGWNDGAPAGGPGGMDMSNSDWSMPPQSKLPPNGNKMNALEIIRCSKPYRHLCDMGFKKEDVESVLRMTNMNMEESMDLLHRSSGGGGGSDWSRRPDGHGGFGTGDQFVTGGGVSGRFAAAAAGVGPMAFQQVKNCVVLLLQNNQNNLGVGSGVFGGGNGPAAGGGSFNSMKFGGGHGGAGGNGGGPVGGGGPPGGGAGVFGGQHQQQQPGGLGGGGGLNQQNAQSQQISNQQLRLLVQQIQLAVQNGYLESQILNQPLAPQTLMLLHQLLTHIKQLNVMQSNLSRTGGGGVNAVQISIAINKLKSQIANLQSQINMQQANYLKQQQQQQQPQQHQQQHQQQPPHPSSLNAANVNVSAIAAAGGHPGNDLFRTPSDLAGLPGSFADMALKDGGGVPFPSSGSTSQQSRLQQWKLPTNSATTPGSLDKDNSDLTDFVRAPGASSKSGPSGSGIDDSTWSNGRNNLGDGWPDSGSQDNKEWPGGNDAFSDLVPEFEPGKPWKGTQATRIEDDPTITPGSVARNPLSIAAAKESNLFGGGAASAASNSKSSPTESTWSFNPSGGGGGGVQGGNYGSKVQKNPWQDANTPTMPPADLWDTPLGANGGKGRSVGMMGGIGKPGVSKLDANGWNTPNTQAGGSNTWNSGASSANSWSSTWIMLKNLTAQIEGSTLRTLCLQHGPVVNFHLFLNHGIALCKYGTREEAQKAQLALNNCQLGNTTIIAEIPNESEIQYILPHTVGNSNGMANGLTSGGGQNWRLSAAAQSQPMVGRSNSVVQDTWSSNAWGSGNTSSSLWNSLDGGPGDRGTPANLNSLLPESLLGTELN
uniref:UBA domain-containing protein n=1 Tax=Anopheles christyi TaxID=43041 RepID=A0A182JP22_9DIPT